MASQRTYSPTDADLLEQLAILEAREDFHAFRRYMRPNLKRGWWQLDAARHLVLWLAQMLAGLRPILVIEAPPQHGKSWLIIDFLAWLFGKHPNLSYLYTSVSERLSVRANLALQRLLDSDKYRRVFPGVRIMGRNPKAGEEKRQRNAKLLEFMAPATGSFRNVTVNGSIVGEGLDVGVIDDPIKGREQANSVTIREKTWNWLNDDFFTRFSDNAGLLIILTRWHLDDPVGRLLLANPKIKVLRYPALATDSAKLMPHDPRKPGSGEPLFPEHKSAEFLLERKATMRPDSFESLYQQNPYIIGGGIFKAHWWRYYTTPPVTIFRYIYADTAQKDDEQHDFTVFQCWGKTRDGRAILLDQYRAKLEAPDLRKQARVFWKKHLAVTGMGPLRKFKPEDKVSGTGLIQELRKGDKGEPPIPVEGIPRNTKDKVERANDAAPSVEAGLVELPMNAPWLPEYLLEFSQFPNGKHDDQVDPTMDAITDLLQGSHYSLENV